MTDSNNTNTIHMTSVEGTVKWFSNRKGFGFLTPMNSTLTEEIFVHQTGIVTNGQFRTLADDSEVKFDVEKEADSGRLKAVNVTNRDGSPIVPPPRQPRRNRPTSGEGDAADDAAAAAAEPEGGSAPTDAKNGGRGRGRSSRGGPGGGNNNRRTNGGNRRTNSSAEGEGTAGEGGATSNNNSSTPREPPFHSHFSEDLRTQISNKGIVLGNRTTIDVALAPHARIKLGQGGYAGICLQTAIVGEGTYVCDPSGALVTFTWLRALKCSADGDAVAWKPYDATQLLPSFSLLDENVGPVQPNETAATLWGADKPDPREAFEANGFQMRRVVLTRPPNSHNHRFRRGGGGRGGGGRRSNSNTEGAAGGQ